MAEDGRNPRLLLPPQPHISIVVPAADEAATIGDCLIALQRARDHLHDSYRGGIGSSVVVVLDSCTDATEDIAARFPVTLLPVHHRRVGATRAAGCALALARDAPWILANTDADSRVPVHWLTSVVGHVLRGADLVLGTVRPGPGLASVHEEAWYAKHDLRAEHGHVHGANLCVTAQAYRRVGGWQPLATGEDVVLAVRARAAGLRVAAVDDAPVHTSSRLVARAPGGFSSYLRGLGAPVTPWSGPGTDLA